MAAMVEKVEGEESKEEETRRKKSREEEGRLAEELYSEPAAISAKSNGPSDRLTADESKMGNGGGNSGGRNARNARNETRPMFYQHLTFIVRLFNCPSQSAIFFV